MNREKLHESLRIHEGLKLKPYQDTEGHLTIGFGHNLDAGITIQQAYMLLDSDIDIAMTELDRALPLWRDHNDARQNVLVEMVFNLGAPRFLTFRNMIADLELFRYADAAAEMRDSLWAKQVKQRAETLAKRMETGGWE